MRTSDAILKWLEVNKDWFKISIIAKKANIDKGNLSKFIKAKSIPEKHLIPIMKVIMPLGFTLDEVIEENNKPENKAKIEEERNPTKKDFYLSDEYGQMRPPPKNLSEWELKQIEERITVIEKELKSPPSNPLIGLKKWKWVRESELRTLKSKL